MNTLNMNDEKVRFSKRFNEALDFRGHGKKTLPELKKIFELAKSQISNLRNGKAMPSIFSGKKLSGELKVSYEWFMTGSGTKEGFQMNNADEIALMFRYRSLTQTGKRELIKAAFNEQCNDNEVNPLNKTNRLDEKQTLLKLVSKD